VHNHQKLQLQKLKQLPVVCQKHDAQH